MVKKQREKKCYTTGTFAKMASVTVRTIRYYDKQNILKPSYISPSGYRLYTDEDFVKLQRILALKYLGFSLEEIRTTPLQSGVADLEESFQLQLRLIRQKKEHLEQMEQALCEAQTLLQKTKTVNWDEILHLIHLSQLEKSLVEQYNRATNLNIRIELHRKYSTNPKGWFPWIYEQLPLKDSSRILEVGCGNGELWLSAKQEDLKGKQILLTDISKGMITDAKSLLEQHGFDFQYQVMDAQQIPWGNEEFDLIIGNHVMFYMKDRKKALSEIARVLKKQGIFVASTYGNEHMKEITEMVQEFDSKIRLSDIQLFEQFGIENGEEQLKKYFKDVKFLTYEDSLLVDKAEPIVRYVLSCHGNQRERLDGKTEQFQAFLEEKIKKQGGISITKSAGIFLATKG